MRHALGAALAALVLAGCVPSGAAERADGLRGPVDDVARDVLAVLEGSVRLAPGEELDALADTQQETCPSPGEALHRVDATLELAAPPPAGLEDEVRAVVPGALGVEYVLEGTTLEVGVVGPCVELGPVRAVELAIEPRYRVRP